MVAPAIPSARENICLFKIGDDALQGSCEFGLLEGLALFVEVAIALEDPPGLWEIGHAVAVERCNFRRGEDEAVGGEADGGRHILSEGELAEVLLRIDQAGDGAGDALDRRVLHGPESGPPAQERHVLQQV